MNNTLAKLIDDDTPQLNPITARGLACVQVPKAPEYLNAVLHAASRDFPDGIKYVKMTEATPIEAYRELAKKRQGTKGEYDMAPNSLYMNWLHFEVFDKQEFLKPLFLPFVGDAGEMLLNGSRYWISQILADRVLTPMRNGIFVRLNRARFTVYREPHYYYALGSDSPLSIGQEYPREAVQVPWAPIYNKDPVMKFKTSLVHYFFSKFGVRETFERFGYCQPVFGNAEITPDKYPSTEWIICKTIYSKILKPLHVGRQLYTPTELRVAVRKSEYTSFVKMLIGGLFYLADHFPEDVTLDYLDSTWMWRVTMGKILFGPDINRGTLHDDITNHIESLDEYIDIITKKQLRDIDINVDNIYDFLAILLENFSLWTISSSTTENSLYNKQLSVLYFLLFDITSAISLMLFKLKAAAKKNLTMTEITQIFRTTLTPKIIYRITKGHKEILTIPTSGDNMAIKITSMMVPQSGSNQQGAANAGGAEDPSKLLHTSIGEVAGYTNIPKSDPSGHSRLNHHAEFDDDFVVVRNPDLREAFDNAQELL